MSIDIRKHKLRLIVQLVLKAPPMLSIYKVRVKRNLAKIKYVSLKTLGDRFSTAICIKIITPIISCKTHSKLSNRVSMISQIGKILEEEAMLTFRITLTTKPLKHINTLK